MVYNKLGKTISTCSAARTYVSDPRFVNLPLFQGHGSCLVPGALQHQAGASLGEEQHHRNRGVLTDGAAINND